MKLELIGFPLDHSWSPEIHRYFLNEEYTLHAMPEEALEGYFQTRDFDGINVTIPYKEKVMQYLDCIDPQAAKIGAVNCIVNRDGVLTGYNTDAIGFMDMLRNNGIETQGRKAAVLGSGGGSKACCAALADLGAEPVTVSRSPGEDSISYDELYQRESEFQILVNATPLGMYPGNDTVPVDLSRFTALEAVVDIVANPLRTALQFEAKIRGIRSLGGFEMLVNQALASDRIFTGTDMADASAEACMREILKKRRSIILIGMPTCGKTTLAEMVAESTGRTLVEMDKELEEEFGCSIREVFAEKGEGYFRAAETALAERLRTAENYVVSCGGGIIKNAVNMRYLRECGMVLWISRDPDKLYGTADRPLSTTRDQIMQLYRERRNLYALYSDAVIENNGTLPEAVEKILKQAGEIE